jgi:hypothetical protein
MQDTFPEMFAIPTSVKASWMVGTLKALDYQSASVSDGFCYLSIYEYLEFNIDWCYWS